MGTIISFFNHKGGVGKTTSVHNIGYGLAKLGKKVLLIDADPQMNLTAAVYGLSTESYYGDDEMSKWKQYNDEYTSLSEVLRNIIQNRNNDITYYKYEDKHCSTTTFDLLRGDIELHELDADIMNLVQSQNSLTKDAVLSLSKKLFAICKDYDFVLLDQSPSAASIINAIFSLTSSYVIVPCTPTFFCLQAINNLVDIWKHWRKLLEPYEGTFNSTGLVLQSQFLGMIIQLGKRWKGGNATHTEEWKSHVNKGLSNFVKLSSSNSIGIDDFTNIFPESKPYIISTYVNYTDKLRSLAEERGVPFVALREDDLPSETSTSKGDANKQYLKSWQSVQETNEYICESLTKLLEQNV